VEQASRGYRRTSAAGIVPHRVLIKNGTLASGPRNSPRNCACAGSGKAADGVQLRIELLRA
jgi:hypothetical protein